MKFLTSILLLNCFSFLSYEMKAGSQLLLHNTEQYGNYLAEALNSTTINTSDYGDMIALSRPNISKYIV